MLRKPLILFFTCFLLNFYPAAVHAQEKHNILRGRFDYIIQTHKETYGSNFFGSAAGLSFERYISNQFTFGISIQNFQNFQNIGLILDFFYISPELRYYLKPKIFRGLYLGVCGGYGFDENSRYITFGPEGGYQLYLLKNWYLDTTVGLGSGRVSKSTDQLSGNSDGLFFHAGVGIGKSF